MYRLLKILQNKPRKLFFADRDGFRSKCRRVIPKRPLVQKNFSSSHSINFVSVKTKGATFTSVSIVAQSLNCLIGIVKDMSFFADRHFGGYCLKSFDQRFSVDRRLPQNALTLSTLVCATFYFCIRCFATSSSSDRNSFFHFHIINRGDLIEDTLQVKKSRKR